MRITLFGGCEARTTSGAVVTPRRKKAQALLAYLALRPGQAHARDKLAALLWGETADEQARASLRQTLFVLRTSLPRAAPAVMVLDGDRVAVNPAAVEVDVASFERRVAEGTPGALQQAVALYKGDLLEGFVVDAAPFEEWLTSERERLREAAVEALGKLLALQMKAGAVEPAIQTAVRLLALDPLQEVVHRVVMQLYARQGRVGAALHQYQVCVQLLQRELGVEPEAETKQAYQEILQRRTAGARDAVVVTSVTRPRRTAPSERRRPVSAVSQLIGRGPELARVRQLLDAAWRGQGKLVAIVGETGIGKTRFVEELGAEAQRRGGQSLTGRSYATAQILPFGPWIDAVRSGQVLRDADFLDAFSPVWRGELARLFPELGVPGLELATTPENALRLFEAMVNLVHQLASRRPLALILENLHWADELSLRLLAFLARRTEGHPVLLAGTMCTEDLAEVPLLSRLLQELDGEARLASIALAPLSKRETVDLVGALTPGHGSPRAPALEERVWAISQGNPLVAVETLRALQHADSPLVGDSVPLPQRVRELITFRLDRLSAVARQLAEVAAVIGCEFEFELLRSAARVDEREAAEGVDELVRRRILQGVGEHFDFVHDRTREAVYERLGPRRRSLHAAVAQALERLHAERLDEVYDRLAYQHSRAEDPDKAITYLVHFSEVAVQSYALKEAVEALQRAVAFVDRLPAKEWDQRHLSLILREAPVLRLLGQYPRLRDLLLAERERVDRLQDPTLRGPYFAWLSLAYGQLGDCDRATESAARALEEATRSDDKATIGQAHAALGFEAYWSGRPRQGVEHGRQAVALLEKRAGTPSAVELDWQGAAYWTLGVNHLLLGEFEAALEALSRAEAIGEAIGSLRAQNIAGGLIGLLRAQRGESEAAVVKCERNLARMAVPEDMATAVLLDAALAAAFLGYACTGVDPARAVEMFERATGLTGAFPVLRIRAWLTAGLSEAYRLAGRPEEARDLAIQTVSMARESQYRHGIGCGQRTLGLVALGHGALAEAVALLGEALDAFSAIEAQYDVGLTQLDFARLAGAQGDREAATLRLREASRLFRALQLPRLVDQTDRVAADLGIAQLA